MRWIIFNYLLLTTTAFARPDTRPKRDLTSLKNLLTSAFFARKHSTVRTPTALNTHDIRFHVGTKQVTSSRISTENKKQKVAPLATMFRTFPEVSYTPGKNHASPNLSGSNDSKFNVKGGFHPKYSYKQFQNKVPVMTFTAHDNPDAFVGEALKVRTSLPVSIKQRINEVVSVGTHPSNVESVRAVFPIEPHTNINITYGQTLFPSFGHLHQNNAIHKTQPSSSESNAPGTNYYKPDWEAKINPNGAKIHPIANLNQPFRTDNIVGIIPPPYIPHLTTAARNINKEAVNKDKSHLGSYAVHRVGIANQEIPSYFYKELNHYLPKSFTVVKAADEIVTTPSNYVIIPPKLNESPLGKHIDELNNTVKDESLTNSQIASKIGVNKGIHPMFKLNESDKFKNNPIVVPGDNTFFYYQKNNDRSALSINGGSSGVSVDVKDNTDPSRGDIPDSLIISK